MFLYLDKNTTLLFCYPYISCVFSDNLKLFGDDSERTCFLAYGLRVVRLFYCKGETIMSKGLTGYPSIDKPWLKYYSKEDLSRSIPQDNMFELIWKSNRDYLSNNAIDFFNKHITYKTMFEEIERLSNSFWACGVRKGDIVTIIAITTPEILYAIYALNRIGAVCSCLYPNMSDDIIKSKVQITNSKYIIVLDLFADKANVFKNDKSISVYLFSFSRSMSTMGKLAFSLKKMPKVETTVISYNQLLSLGEKTQPEYT